MTEQEKYNILKSNITHIGLPQWLDELCNKKILFSSFKKRNDYLYDLEYDEPYDYEFANKYFKDNYMTGKFSCSSCKVDDYYGRNFDWYYDNAVTFTITTPSTLDTFGSVGVVGAGAGLTKDLVDSRQLVANYRALPFLTVDGKNECGVVINTNVVDMQGAGVITSGTNPEGEDLCMLMIPRLVMDKASSVDNAITLLQSYNIYCPNGGNIGAYEYHFMIADDSKTCIIEFRNNEMIVTEVGTDEHPAVMTNFRVDGTVMTEDGVDYTTVDPYGAGVERYNILSAGLGDVDSVDDMHNLMRSVYYTKAYTNDFEDAWMSEFESEDLGLTIQKLIENKSDYEFVYDIAQDYYTNRSRETGETWQTVHSCVYSGNKLYLYIQEESPTYDGYYEYDIPESDQDES